MYLARIGGHGDSIENTVEENSRVFLSLKPLVAVSKGMWAVERCIRKSSVLNWRCQLMQVDPYNGCKMVVMVVS